MLRHLCFVGALATSLAAQSPLTTVFTGNTSLAAGATAYVDLVLNAPLTFTQIDINTTAVASTAGTLEVRWCPTTYVGNDTNPAAWTLVSTAPVVSAGPNLPTVCTLQPFTLPPGNYGLAVTHIGIGPLYITGNGTAVPGSGSNQTYSTAELTLLAGATAAAAPGTAICCTPRVFNCNLYYNLSGSGTVATRTNYGAGCYLRVASFYENFATSAAFDLASSAISMIPTGSGYVVLPGLTTYVAPSAAATQLTLGDDTETAITLAAPFTYPGGSTSSLTVCSNGYVSVASGNGTAFTPVVATTLAAPQTGWWNQHDYNPAAVGSGQVKFETIGSIAYVTWDGVYDFGGTSAANANTFQFQFDTATGAVHIVFQGMSVLGNARLVGYSPGGASADPGNQDLSATLPATFTLSGNDVPPLTLAASARPLIGTTINLDTSSVTGSSIGINFLSLGQIPAPGFDLGVLGAPGCPALVDVNQSVGNAIGNALPGLSLSVPLVIPNSVGLLAFPLFSQSIWLDATANTFGALTSNGVALVLGNL